MFLLRFFVRVFAIFAIVLGVGVGLAWAWDRSDDVAAHSASAPAAKPIQ